MSSKVTIRQSKGVGVVGLLALIAGVVLIVAGGLTWWTVSYKLAQEDITVSEDASFLAGRFVNDPFTAYAQADVINNHALEMSDGQTYAELDQDDPRRDTVMNASFLRASLFTSVVSFGIAALVVGLGLLFVLVGWALRRLAGGPPVVVETTSSPAAPAEPAAPAAPGEGSGGGAPSGMTAVPPVATRVSSKAHGEPEQKDDAASDATKDKEPASRRPSAAPATSATPVVAAATGKRSSSSKSRAAQKDAASSPVPPAPDEPIRMSRSERVNGATSPAPAGVRPVPKPTVGSELPAGPKGDARLEELEGTSSGWASPADRVPPVEDKPGKSSGDQS
ncbi:hypothetical protein [Sanguibacter antarcticus]|uniref:Aromatic ring-opening dioxygenase LigA n=1 Tax=Sanguibacter antarcticus TaxID=372484 RepID=A0A2A9E504_9MICO|nr:hypothetical protein ATL42_1833 [Sanguibacter antarcticus]